MIDKKISNRIKLLGLIMTFFVVFYHSGWYDLPSTGPFDDKMIHVEDLFLEYSGGMTMSFFFTVTAFLLFRGFTMNQYVDKVKKRFMTLFIPYFLWQGIYIVFYTVVGTFNPEGLFRKLFLFGAWPPHGPLWYVYTIWVLALITPVFYILFKNRKLGAVLMFVMTLVLYRLTFVDTDVLTRISEYSYMSNVLIYIYSYFYGAYFGLHYDEIDSDGVMKICIMMIVGALCFDAEWEGFFMFFLRKLIPIMLIYFMPISDKVVSNKIIKTACGMTFLVYAVHPAISAMTGGIIKKVIYQVIPISWISDFIGRSINVVLFFVIVYVMRLVMSKICPKLLALLSGGRVA